MKHLSAPEALEVLISGQKVKDRYGILWYDADLTLTCVAAFIEAAPFTVSEDPADPFNHLTAPEALQAFLEGKEVKDRDGDLLNDNYPLRYLRTSGPFTLVEDPADPFNHRCPINWITEPPSTSDTQEFPLKPLPEYLDRALCAAFENRDITAIVLGRAIMRAIDERIKIVTDDIYKKVGLPSHCSK